MKTKEKYQILCSPYNGRPQFVLSYSIFLLSSTLSIVKEILNFKIISNTRIIFSRTNQMKLLN